MIYIQRAPLRGAMAPRKKATKRGATRKAGSKQARRTAKKGAKRATRKAAKRTTKKATKKSTKRTGRKPAKRTTAAKRSAPAQSRPKSVKFTTRKRGVFTQTDLLDHIQAWNPDLPKAQARQVVNDMLETLQAAVKKTDRVRLKGIGTITKKKIPARKGGKLVRNPFSGEMVKQKPKPASVKVKLSPAKELKSP